MTFPHFPAARGAVLLAVLVLAVLVLPAGRAAARPAAVDPGFDLTAALAALETEPVHRVPGAPARFDAARVRPLLGPDTRVLLMPYTPLELGAAEHYERVLRPVDDWACDRDLDVVTVTGLQVRSEAGSWGSETLDGVRARLAHLDVTTDLALALENLRSGVRSAPEPPARPVPPDPAELAAVLAGLATSRTHGSVPDGRWIDDALPGGRARVVALPALAPGAPDPDLLPALRAAHPDDVVVVLRGRWIEAAGPDPETGSARDYVLGRYDELLPQRQVEPRAIARLFLERLALLRSGEPFGRPRPQAVGAAALAALLTPWTIGGTAVVLGGGSVLGAVLRSRRRAEQIGRAHV